MSDKNIISMTFYHLSLKVARVADYPCILTVSVFTVLSIN